MRICLFVLIFFFGCMFCIGYIWDLWEWNEGVSRKSGGRWIRFDKDSGGSRGYSDEAGNTIWISWGVDRREVDRRL